MKIIDQWNLTLLWSLRLSIGFFLIYATAVWIKAPLLYNDVKNVLSEEMSSNFVGMAIIAPFLFTALFLIAVWVIVRLVFWVLTFLARGNLEPPR